MATGFWRNWRDLCAGSVPRFQVAEGRDLRTGLRVGPARLKYAQRGSWPDRDPLAAVTTVLSTREVTSIGPLGPGYATRRGRSSSSAIPSTAGSVLDNGRRVDLVVTVRCAKETDDGHF